MEWLSETAEISHGTILLVYVVYVFSRYLPFVGKTYRVFENGRFCWYRVK